MTSENVRFYREPRPEVKSGKWFSVIQDNGSLKAAVKNSNGDFLFSEVGAGVFPLVIIGSATDILTYLTKINGSIVNEIKELPDIYMGLDYYVPKERFEGLFPVSQTLTLLTNGGAGFVPGSTLTDVVDAVSTVANTLIDISKDRHRKKIDPQLLYLKVSYLPEEGLAKIAQKSISLIGLAELAFDAFLKAQLIKTRV